MSEPLRIDLESLSTAQLRTLLGSARETGRHEVAARVATVLAIRSGAAQPPPPVTRPRVARRRGAQVGLVGASLTVVLLAVPSSLSPDRTPPVEGPLTAPRAAVALAHPVPAARTAPPRSAVTTEVRRVSTPPATTRRAEAHTMPRRATVAATPSRPADAPVSRVGGDLVVASRSGILPGRCDDRRNPSARMLCEDARRVLVAQSSGPDVVDPLGAALPRRGWRDGQNSPLPPGDSGRPRPVRPPS